MNMLCSAAVLTVYILAVQGQPVSKMFGVDARIPQQRFTAQQQRFAPSRYQPIPLDYQYSHGKIKTQLQAEAEAAPASTPVQKEAEAAPAGTPEYVNIYEEALEKCIEDDYCPYRSAEMASHDVCATIRTSMAVESYGMSWGAGSNDVECMNILGFGAASNKRRARNRGYVVIPQCNALPAGVLDSAFSLDMMKGTTLKEHVVTPNYNPESSALFADGGLRDKKGTWLGGSKTQYTRATNNFRQAITNICELCAAEAPNEKAKENLATACAKIKALETVEAAERETSDISGFIAGLVGAFVVGGVISALLRYRSAARSAAEEPFMEA